MPNNRSSDVHRRRIDREIRKQQASTSATIPRQSFARVVHEVIQDEQFNRGEQYDINLRSDALDALQCAGEQLITEMFTKAKNLATYSGRDTVNESDLRFVNGALPVCRGRTEVCERVAVPVDEEQA